MHYISYYDSPIGNILLASDDIGLTGLWFKGQKYFAQGLNKYFEQKNTIFIKEAKTWLDIYFSGKKPDFTPKIHFIGTNFQKEIWGILSSIPYGTTTTYGVIAQQLANKQGIKKMSAQAVGSAVGHNKISIIVPCHRVIGTNNKLTGYAAGINKKIFLLNLEGINLN